MRTFLANGRAYTLTGEAYIHQDSSCPSPVLMQDVVGEDGESSTCEWDCHSFGEEEIADMSNFTSVWWEGDEYDIHEE